jgi:hypothetical protein
MHVLRVESFDRKTSICNLVLNWAVGYQYGPRVAFQHAENLG